jgi:phosphatidylserine/phosphatidylglycerophosphate/cardiolipin synthase-like enzyme
MHPIRAIPSRYPRPDEISLDELSDVIRRLWKRRGKEKPPELISVRSVLKGVKTMYLPAVMLQYELTGGLRRQRQVAFAVDGVVDEEYERAFAASSAAEKLPELFLPSFKSTPQLVAEYVPPHIASQLGNLEGVDEIVERLEVTSEKIESRTDRLEESDHPDTRQVLREELERERAEKVRLEQELAQRRVRRLRTFDCARLLVEALDSVAERLVILSAFLSTDAVDHGFLRRLEDALKRGVRVWIGYGMGKRDARQLQRDVSANWSLAESELDSLRKKYDRQFELRDFGDTHEKILLCDKKYVVSGSYNWLSFKANLRSKKRRQEDALMVTVPEVVEKYFDEITSRFSSGR